MGIARLIEKYQEFIVTQRQALEELEADTTRPPAEVEQLRNILIPVALFLFCFALGYLSEQSIGDTKFADERKPCTSLSTSERCRIARIKTERMWQQIRASGDTKPVFFSLHDNGY